MLPLRILGRKWPQSIGFLLFSTVQQSYSWDLSISFQYVHMRSTTRIRLPSPSHCEFWSRNCLNQLYFNCAQVCSYHFRSCIMYPWDQQRKFVSRLSLNEEVAILKWIVEVRNVPHSVFSGDRTSLLRIGGHLNSPLGSCILWGVLCFQSDFINLFNFIS